MPAVFGGSIVTSSAQIGDGVIVNADINASADIARSKLADISATARLLGRKTAGSGAEEELTIDEAFALIGALSQGDIIFQGASGLELLNAGTAGDFLKTGGAGADPSWDTPASGGNAAGVLIPQPIHDEMYTLSEQQGVGLSKTTMYCGLYTLPKCSINDIRFEVFEANGTGTMGIAIYSEDGATQYLEHTTASIDSTGWKSETLSSQLDLDAGNYWIGWYLVGATDLKMTGYQQGNAGDDFWDDTTNGPVTLGSVTIPSANPGSTITPPTSGSQCAPRLRLDV